MSGLLVIRDHRAGPRHFASVARAYDAVSYTKLAEAELVIVVPDNGPPQVVKCRERDLHDLDGETVDVPETGRSTALEDAQEAVQRSDRLQQPTPDNNQAGEIRELRAAVRALIQAVEESQR